MLSPPHMAGVFMLVRISRQDDLCLLIQIVLQAGFLIQSSCVVRDVSDDRGRLMLDEL
jgi:hypothetical protein